MMKVLRLDHFRERLETERESLKAELAELDENGLRLPETDAIGELSSYDQHPSDHGTETFEREKDVGLRTNAGILLRHVEDALRRIDEGSYGTCERCGRPISEERLEAIPYTSYCITCASALEDDGEPVRPVEEDVLDPAFARTFTDDAPDRPVIFDGEDAWQAVARYGTANTPQDVPDAGDMDDAYINADEDLGTVEGIDGVIDETETALPDPDSLYEESKEGRRRMPHKQEWKGTRRP